jgi:subtilisin family serine protease
MKKIKSRWMAFGIFFMCITFPAYAGELSPGLSEKLQYTHHKEHIAVIVRMADQANLKTSTHDITEKNKALRSRKVIRALKATAISRQKNLIGFLEKEKASGNVLDHTSFWIFNGFSLKATPEIIKELSSRNDVETITEDFPISPPVSFTSTPVQSDSLYTWNIERVRAPQVWNMGYSGSGVVVGIFDTGVDVTHPDLAEKYRGGDNSWFDPHGEHAVPVDAAGSFSGHGTHVAGIIMGGDSSGKYIGVAPEAKWSTARIWNDAGEEASSKEVHEIFQWFMDPDRDPETDDAPDVVNCSWGFKLLDTFPWCLPDFQDDIEAWRMAGIIPVFSAGNSGPRFFTGESPGNYPETIAVAATDYLDNIAFFSSRGPGNCNLSIFPDISAPGVAIYSSTLDEKHRTLSGTSAAVPHVVGTIALMLDANPNLSIETIESILRATAKPLGYFYPNFTYGWGQVDALAAVNAVMP